MPNLGDLRQAYADRRYDDAWAIYRALDATGEAGAEAHLLGARAAMRRGEIVTARWVIDRVDEEETSGHLRGEFRFTRGLVLQLVGEVRAAIDQLQACIAGMPEYPELEPVMAGAVWNNLGLLYRQARQPRDAIDAYERACIWFRSEHMPNYLCQALQNLAWAACVAGDQVRARAALDETEPLCSSEEFRWHQRLTQAFVDSLGDMQGKRRALEICEQITGSTYRMPHDVRSHACWLAGRIALELGQVDAAHAFANQAVHYGSLARDENRCLMDAADLLRQVRQIRLRPQPPGSD